MEYLYQVHTAKGSLVVSTRDFDLALQVYAGISTRDGWPRFSYKPLPAPAIPGYPDAFLPAQA